MAVISALGLVGVDKCYFPGRFAVEQLSFDVAPGGVLGLIGPNGAGKTTTILMLAGLLQPSAGTLRVLGGSGPSGSCAGDAGQQSVAPANNLELGTAISSSAPNPFAAVNPNNPQTWDRYAYVGGIPDGLTDPYGLVNWCTVGRVTGAVLGGVGGVAAAFTEGVGGVLWVAGWYIGGVTNMLCGTFD